MELLSYIFIKVAHNWKIFQLAKFQYPERNIASIVLIAIVQKVMGPADEGE
jgi:hypothetical protein